MIARDVTCPTCGAKGFKDIAPDWDFDANKDGWLIRVADSITHGHCPSGHGMLVRADFPEGRKPAFRIEAVDR